MNFFKKYWYIPTTIFCIVLLACIFTGPGCSKKENLNVVSTNTISIPDLTTILNTNGIVCFDGKYTDKSYQMPSEKWIKGEFSSALFDFLTSFKSSKWVSEENDCDNFAVMTYAFSQILHHNTPNKLRNTGLSVGEFWYIKDVVGPHAINVIIVKSEKDGFKVLFYEPQTQSVITLTKQEINSCYFYRF